MRIGLAGQAGVWARTWLVSPAAGSASAAAISRRREEERVAVMEWLRGGWQKDQAGCKGRNARIGDRVTGSRAARRTGIRISVNRRTVPGQPEK
jgi:hypothetical protein